VLVVDDNDAAAGALGVRREGAGVAEVVVHPLQHRAQGPGEAGAQGLARVVDGGGIDHAHGQAEVLFAGQGQEQGLEGVLGGLIAQGAGQGGGEAGFAGGDRSARGAA
jgi:hypothetical protein